MLQSVSSVFIVYRRKTLTGSLDPMHANGMDKPCIITERSQNTILLASTQAVYKAPHSTVRGQSVIIIGAEAVATVEVGVSECKA